MRDFPDTEDRFQSVIFWELYNDLERHFEGFLEYVPYVPENERGLTVSEHRLNLENHSSKSENQQKDSRHNTTTKPDQKNVRTRFKHLKNHRTSSNKYSRLLGNSKYKRKL